MINLILIFFIYMEIFVIALTKIMIATDHFFIFIIIIYEREIKLSVSIIVYSGNILSRFCLCTVSKLLVGIILF